MTLAVSDPLSEEKGLDQDEEDAVVAVVAVVVAVVVVVVAAVMTGSSRDTV